MKYCRASSHVMLYCIISNTKRTEYNQREVPLELLVGPQTFID
jgi:hypothetical protein